MNSVQSVEAQSLALVTTLVAQNVVLPFLKWTMPMEMISERV